MTPSTLDEQALRERISDFLDHYALLVGDEKGEAQVFLDRFFQALGHRGVKEAGAVLEDRVRGDRSVHFADLMWDDVVLFEMKKRGEDLKNHYTQAERYWLEKAKGRPRYVVTCNFDEFWIYDFERQLYQPVDIVSTPQLADRWEAFGFMLPKPIEPLFDQNLEEVSKSAAASIAGMVAALIASGVERQQAQRFGMQCVTAMFAEDTGLIPRHLFTRAVSDAADGKVDAYDVVFGLFREMDTPGTTAGGRFEGTPYFNGDLYARSSPFLIPAEALETLRQAANLDWATIQPEIFGTLFEKFLDDDQRHALGAHFTTATDIMRVVRPTIVDPYVRRIRSARTQKALGEIETELTQLRILDPACGSGNFLYVAYRELRKLETLIEERRNQLSTKKRARTDRLALVSPDQFFGIDVDPFAVEIARITLLVAKQLTAFERSGAENPLPLDRLDSNIVVGDALFDPWPEFDLCIGNPPYLGRRQLSDDRTPRYISDLDERFPDVRGLTDYVVYWIRLAHERLPDGGRAGLVTTNSVRQGSSRTHGLDYIVSTGATITEAVSSIPWSGEAGVHVSIVNWTKGASSTRPVLWIDDDNPVEVDRITGSLSPAVDVSGALDLQANKKPKPVFQGQTQGHDGFVVADESEAVRLGWTPTSPGSACVHPFLSGEHLLHQLAPTRWVIDLPHDDPSLARRANTAAFDLISQTVLPTREQAAEEERTKNQQRSKQYQHHRRFLDTWWQLSYRRSDLMSSIEKIKRYIAVAATASHNRMSVFAPVDSRVHPTHGLQVFPVEDEFTLGVLQSDVHLQWMRARSTSLKADPRFTTTLVTHTFPWPQSGNEALLAAVEEAAAEILNLRAQRFDAGVPLGDQYDGLRLPGKNPLRDLHHRLDEAVRALYGLEADEPDIVRTLLALNHELASEEEAGRSVIGPATRPARSALTEHAFPFA